MKGEQEKAPDGAVKAGRQREKFEGTSESIGVARQRCESFWGAVSLTSSLGGKENKREGNIVESLKTMKPNSVRRGADHENQTEVN